MAANSHLVLMNGPAFSGREFYIKKHFSETHVTVSPKEMFDEDCSVGLRDVILSVVNKLKKGNKVVVDDENSAASTRKSYINVVEKKVPTLKSKALVTIRPKYGLDQMYWTREFNVADQIESTSTVRSLMSDSDINKWFHSDDNTNIQYRPGIVDKPTEHEGFTLYQVDLPLTTNSNFKFELPVLFLQWEGIIQKTEDNFSLHRSVVRLCELWSEAYPWGRIIVICDGIISEPLEIEHIKSVLYQLIKDFNTSPVYVLQVTDQTLSGSYTRPPKPGLLAFLQKRHHLNLQSKSTLYLYHHQSHKEMSDSAGVQNIKIGKVLHNPLLVLTPQIASRPIIPPFLETIELQKSDRLTIYPTIPSYTEMSKLDNHHMYKQLGFGKSEFIFAWDKDCIERYQTLYAEFATHVDEPVSKIQEIIDRRAVKRDTPSKTPLQRSSPNLSNSSNRDLPKWMIGNTKNHVTKPSLSKSESSSSTDGKIKQTVYIMTEKELVEIATDLLKQAGREDLLKQNSQQMSPRNHSSCTNIPTKLVECEKSEPDTSKQNVIITTAVAGASSTTKIDTSHQTVASPCQPVPGTSKQHVLVKSNLIGSCDDIGDRDSQDNTNDLIGDSSLHQEAEKHQSHITQSKSKTAVLDSFMNDDYTRKSSPKKKRKIDRLLETYSGKETTVMVASDDSKTEDCQSEDIGIQTQQSAQLCEDEQSFTALCDTNESKKTQKTITVYCKSEKASPSKSKRKQERDFSVLDEIFN